MPRPAPEADSLSRTLAVALSHIEKSYPGVRALRGVDLAVEAGTVHALVGENGAGKSTLLKVLTGAVVPDAGSVEIGGERIPRLTPRLARKLGVRLVSQERQIAPDLSVAENVLLGRMPRGRSGRVDWRAVRRIAGERLDRMGLEVDPRVPARELGVAQLQTVEIARALSSNARVIVLDEPTAALGAPEIERLFANLRDLRDAGVAIVYVSHHLSEIFEIADSVTVLRDGQRVAERPVAGLDTAGLVELMLGRSLGELERAQQAIDEREVALRVRGLSCAPALRGVDVAVRRGEILCITGAIGSGRRELGRCVAGLEAPDAGIIELDGIALVLRTPRHALRRGIVFLPEDRKREGLLLDLDLVDNVGVGRLALQRSPLAARRQRRRQARELCTRLRVRTPGVSQPVRLLSGGNQQKIMLGRWLNVAARVFVFDEPTAGIDVGSKLEIYDLLRDLAGQGAAILVLSSDFEEIKLVADRVIVLRRGRVAGELRGGDINEHRMLTLQVAR
jgi:ABC-type sugar transport system ATPase subunit